MAAQDESTLETTASPAITALEQCRDRSPPILNEDRPGREQSFLEKFLRNLWFALSVPHS